MNFQQKTKLKGTKGKVEKNVTVEKRNLYQTSLFLYLYDNLRTNQVKINIGKVEYSLKHAMQAQSGE
jgi:hypothetical protein